MNLVVLFLSDRGQQVNWENAPMAEVADEAGGREIEVLHIGRKSQDLLLRLPEGSKAWEAKVGFESAWKDATGVTPLFIARPAGSVSLSFMKGGELFHSLSIPRKDKSAGIVFMETRGIEKMIEEECERISKSLASGGADILLGQPIAKGDVFVVKAGKESDQPSFARVARLVQECYRSVIERPVPVAGRGLGSLKSLNSVIEEHAPGMHADAVLLSEARREHPRE